MAAPNLESVLEESREFPVPPAFARDACVTPERLRALRARAESDFLGFWGDLGREYVQWIRPFTKVLDDSSPPFYRWFVDGRLNAAANCLDRHLTGQNRNKAALVWEGEDGGTRTFTYAQLHRDVARLAGALRRLGVEPGQVVTIYLPLVPEVVVAMLACARIGAPHSVIFAGFSSQAVADRIEDAQSRIVITADGGFRGGKVVPLKANLDDALTRDGHSVRQVIVLKRTGAEVLMKPGRDLWWEDTVRDADPVREPVEVDAEHPLYILYTSGSTGRPKGVVNATGGYLAWAHATMRWVFDIRPTDVFWCTADVGWVTGHTYVVYGPLMAGATVLLYEGAPMHPDAGRFWSMVERHGVTVFYTAPTAIRAFMRQGDPWPKKYDLSSLRLLGTVGEPINPEAWTWYHGTIGGGRCPIVDTWWQTETGGILISPIPGATTLKPGSCTFPLPGIFADVVDESGTPVRAPNQGGALVITKPWPAMLRTLWRDDERYRKTYWSQFGPRTYAAGDSAFRDEAGYFRILGRLDDVLKVSGHRLGTMEIESALVSHPRVAEAAVVGRPHPVKGEAICAFVVLRRSDDAPADASKLAAELADHVAKQIGPVARPDDVRITDALPKTRSGKIMRRLLRSIAQGEEIRQDTSTLEDEGVVVRLQH